MATMKYINVSLEAFGGMICLFILFNLFLSDYEKSPQNRCLFRMIVCNLVVLLSDTLAWLTKGYSNWFCYYSVRIANFVVFSSGYVLLALFTSYLLSYVKPRKAISVWPSRIIWSMCFIAVLLTIVSQFNNMYYRIDENNLYQRQDWFWLSQFWAILCMIIEIGIICNIRKVLERREFLALSSYIILAVVAMAIQIFVYGLALLYFANSLSALCMYMNLQVEQAKQYKERELELEKSRTQIMISQIQPHFLFNSLTSICYLCRTNPLQAEQVVVHFSNFLRGNIESLNSINPIPFSRELSHLEHYLEIEKVRYGERLNIVYDIQTEGFMLPSLTVQPIVENAVRHGVGQKSTAGTITISSKETADEFIITVTDDGVGFDTAVKPDDGRIHVGIHNVQQRLRQQTGGDLRIDSIPGKGTTTVITIPKHREKRFSLPRIRAK